MANSRAALKETLRCEQLSRVSEMPESGIRLHRLGYPTSSSRIPDFERSATRLERVGYPTWTSRLLDIVRRKQGSEDRIRGMRRVVNGAVSLLHQLPQQWLVRFWCARWLTRKRRLWYHTHRSRGSGSRYANSRKPAF